MFLKNVKNYLQKDDYNINLYKNALYISNYQKVDHIAEDNVRILFDTFSLIVKGNHITVDKMMDKEILFNGTFESVTFHYK